MVPPGRPKGEHRWAQPDGSPVNRIWRAPVAIGIVSAAGLVAALVADGPWDLLSTACLGLPVLLCAWYGLRRGRAGPDGA